MEVAMGLRYVHTRHLVAGSLCYACYGSHHFYGSYDTDGTGSAANFTEVMTRTGQEARPFLRKL